MAICHLPMPQIFIPSMSSHQHKEKTERDTLNLNTIQRNLWIIVFFQKKHWNTRGLTVAPEWPWCWAMGTPSWRSWGRPHTGCPLRHMPGPLGPIACCPRPGRCSWGRRCCVASHFPWCYWWPEAAAQIWTRSPQSPYEGYLRDTNNATGMHSLAFTITQDSIFTHGRLVEILTLAEALLKHEFHQLLFIIV